MNNVNDNFTSGVFIYFWKPQKSLGSIHIYLKIPISNSKAFKIILSVWHPLTPQKISESGNGTLCKQTLHIKLWFSIYFKRITLDQTIICILEFSQFPFSTNTLKLLLILTHFLMKITSQNIFFFWPFHCRQYFMIFQLWGFTFLNIS